MNYIRHLAGFFDRVAKDDRLGPLHISMYVSLFQFWNASRFKNPLSISRSELMRVSKISAKATYHKCIRELNNYGYIRYEPSYNPIRGSLVYLFNFETGDRAVNERKRSSNGHATEQVDEPYTNDLNIKNSKTAYEQSDENTSSNCDGAGEEAEEVVTKSKPVSVPSSVDEVRAFFEKEKSTRREAEKFYNYFQSNGWKIGGRAPMKDWQAAARNWILNSTKFESQGKSPHQVTTSKNYGEPL